MSQAAPLVDEVANELVAWPGVEIEQRPDGAALVRFKRAELGVLDRDRGLAEIHVTSLEHDELIEHGDASPSDRTSDFETVSHNVERPSDVTSVLELFDHRYREARGEHYPDSLEQRD